MTAAEYTNRLPNVSIHRLCEEFAEAAFPNLKLGSTPERAYDRCWELSLAFSWYCKGRGLRALMVRCEEPIRKFSEGVETDPVLFHWVVSLPDYGYAVDWTARQFWHDAKHPLLIDRGCLGLYWGVIEDGVAV